MSRDLLLYLEDIDEKVLWDVVQNGVPALLSQIKAILASEGGSQNP